MTIINLPTYECESPCPVTELPQVLTQLSDFMKEPSKPVTPILSLPPRAKILPLLGGGGLICVTCHSRPLILPVASERRVEKCLTEKKNSPGSTLWFYQCNAFSFLIYLMQHHINCWSWASRLNWGQRKCPSWFDLLPCPLGFTPKLTGRFLKRGVH